MLAHHHSRLLSLLALMLAYGWIQRVSKNGPISIPDTDPYFAEPRPPVPWIESDYSDHYRAIGLEIGRPFRLTNGSTAWIPIELFWSNRGKVVFHAREQEGARRSAAIKVIFHADAMNPELVAARDLTYHPNILAMYESGLMGGHAVMVTEWAEYGTLRTYTRHHRANNLTIDPGIGRQFFHDIVRGLAHIHAAGYAHGDACLANVFVVRESNRVVAKLADFDQSQRRDAKQLGFDLQWLCDNFRDLVAYHQRGVEDVARDALRRGICEERWSAERILQHVV